MGFEHPCLEECHLGVPSVCSLTDPHINKETGSGRGCPGLVVVCTPIWRPICPGRCLCCPQVLAAKLSLPVPSRLSPQGHFPLPLASLCPWAAGDGGAGRDGGKRAQGGPGQMARQLGVLPGVRLRMPGKGVPRGATAHPHTPLHSSPTVWGKVLDRAEEL